MRKRFKASFLYSVFPIPMLARCKWVKTDTPQDPSLNNEMLATDNSVARPQGDRDRTGGRASASHGNDRNGHGVQGVEATFAALSVVELEDRLCYDLGFRISPVAGGLHKKNGSWAMDKTHIRLSDAIGFATHGERDDVTRRYSGATFVEA